MSISKRSLRRYIDACVRDSMRRYIDFGPEDMDERHRYQKKVAQLSMEILRDTENKSVATGARKILELLRNYPLGGYRLGGEVYRITNAMEKQNINAEEPSNANKISIIQKILGRI